MQRAWLRRLLVLVSTALAVIAATGAPAWASIGNMT